MRSAYFDYKFDSTEPYNGLGYLEKPFFDLMTRLCNLGIGHHYLDETLLAKYGRVEGKQLILGNCTYDYVILPYMLTMDRTTEKLLREFVANGGKVLLDSKKPQYLEGKRFDYNYLKSNTSLDEIIKNQPYSMKQAKKSDVRAAYRRAPDGRDFIYAVNLGEDTRVTFNIRNKASFDSYDIFTDTYKTVGTNLFFEKGQAYILYLSENQAEKTKKLKKLTLEKHFELCAEVENYITLDMISYSTDGENYTAPRHHMCVQNELLDMRYQGKVYLKYTVNIDTPPTKCVLLAENTNTLSLTVNGKGVSATRSDFDICSLAFDIQESLKSGINEIVMEIDYHQGENVYYALFGENVTESLKNCLAYDTDIEPVYLKGDFGVYGDFEENSQQGTVLGTNFRIGKQKKEIDSLIYDGYPFFKGDITVSQTVELNDTGYTLFIPERFHLIDVRVNGEYAGRMMFSHYLDLSKHLRKGKNKIELTLTVGLRNLLGPFHTHKEQSFVGPETFERFGSWKDGQSPWFNPKYAFVKAMI